VTTLADYHVQRLGALQSGRGNWNTQWEEAAERIVPSHRTTFSSFGQTSTMGVEGQKKTELQFDSTAALAAMRFGSVIESLATPQNSLWHGLKVTDKVLRKNRQVRQYFDDLTEVLFSQRYRPKANFVGNSQQSYFGLGVYGNGILFVDAPENGRGLRYRNVHLGEAYLVENHAGVIDTMYRLFPLSARQIVEKFGVGNVPDSVKGMIEQPAMTDKKHEILHVVQPRADYDPQRIDSMGMPFESIYIFKETKDILREGGYRTFPYAITRYTQAPGETYGRGPAQIVLPAIKVLNEEKKTVLKQGHRVTDPVLLAHDDGKLGNFSLKSGALNKGGVSRDGRLLVQPLPTGNIVIGDKLMEMERQTINDAFLVTLFQILVDSPQMTATEVLERTREKGMLLAPTAGRMQAEFLGALIERELDVLTAQGLVPPMPPILMQAEVEYRIEYNSPMSRMQRMEKATGFMRALDMAAAYAKDSMDPSPLDHFAFDRAMPDVLDIMGSPVEWTSTDDEVAQKRAGRAQAAQQQQVVDAAPAIASVAKANPKGMPA
jgi:hypothetical protein